MVWFSAPYTFGKARPANDYMTTARTTVMSRHSVELMASLGIPVVDAGIITQSRWDSSHDGLHYGSPQNTEDGRGVVWAGQVSFMVAHVVLNTVFPTCSGN